MNLLRVVQLLRDPKTILAKVVRGGGGRIMRGRIMRSWVEVQFRHFGRQFWFQRWLERPTTELLLM